MPAHNAPALRAVLDGEPQRLSRHRGAQCGRRAGGRRPGRAICARARDWRRDAIDSGAAQAALDKLIAVSNRT